MSYSWPGNVREFANVIQRAIVFSRGIHIRFGCGMDLCLQPVAAMLPMNFRSAREEAIQAFERAYVKDLLHRNQGNVTWAAREAGQERRAFERLVKKCVTARTSPMPGQC